MRDSWISFVVIESEFLRVALCKQAEFVLGDVTFGIMHGEDPMAFGPGGVARVAESCSVVTD